MATDTDKDGPYFAYRASTAIRIIKALQAAREIEACLRATIPYLSDPEAPPNHPCFELLARCEDALKAWKEGAGI